MKRHVNLMSETAKFRTATRVHVRTWLLALSVIGCAMVPLAMVRLQESRKAANEQEAMEATYEPIRRLVKLNRDLRDEAVSLVRDDRLALELSHSRPVGALLNVVSDAAAKSNGELFVEHLGINQRPPGAAGISPAASMVAPEQRMRIEAAATLTYDIADFVESLAKAPIKGVKVTSDVIVSEGGADRKNYIIECTF